MAKTFLDTSLTAGILEQLLDEQLKEIRAETDKMVNENGPEKDEIENEIKEDTEPLENNIDKGLPKQESEMVKLEAVDAEMEKTFTQVPRIMKQSNAGVMMLEEWNEAMDREIKRHPELTEIELREKGFCVQFGVNSEEKATKSLMILLEEVEIE
ncbi:Hypothetical predicted protein [Podarcis lilfordi]|uniref:Uncharacterized protein n=1 Tax=Podarcis lilfordi TaxID=74358 RepID=A0AA35K7P3_9SAUR|nr:Hypothetical predicted protein [Podarcis lilfordi]